MRAEEILDTPVPSSLSAAPAGQTPAPLTAVPPTRLPPVLPPAASAPTTLDRASARADFPSAVRPDAVETQGVRQVAYFEEQVPGTPGSELSPSSRSPVQPVAGFEPIGQPSAVASQAPYLGQNPAPGVLAVDGGVARLPATNAASANGDGTRNRDATTQSAQDNASSGYPKPIGNSSFVFESLPQTQLWRVPMANQREPRCSAKLSSENNQPLIDTAIGAVFGLARVGPADNPREGIELGAFACVFTRFLGEGHPIAGDDREALPLTAIDYRAGLPLMIAKGDWQMKIGYEHTSCHLGDEYMLLDYNYGLHAGSDVTIRAVRDEAVLGVARFFGEAVRLYGQFGYSFSPSDSLVGKTPIRYDWGLEYSPPAPPRGGPFAAFDMDLRAEQDFFRNITFQTGWQWKTNENRRSSARIGVEYYDGRSPYGQFYLERESSWGAMMIYEW